MSLNPQIDKHPNGDLWLVWDADPKAECYRMVAPDGTVHQVGKKQTAVRLGKPAQPFTVSLAPAYAIPSMVETITYPDAPPPVSSVPRCGISVGGEMLFRSDVDRGTALDRIAEAGAKLIRFDCPAGAEWYVDRFLAEAELRGLAACLILGGDQHTPPGETQWRAQVAGWRDRYTAKGVRLFVTSNEPNGNNKTGFTPKIVARLGIIAHDELHKANVDVRLGVGELSLPSGQIRSWAAGMYAEPGFAGSLDAFTFHGYDDPAEHGSWSAWDAVFDGSPSSVGAIMAAHGDGHIPVWSTESGGPSQPGKYDLAKQATIVRNALTDPRVESACIYTIDNGDVDGFGIYGRPAYDAFKAAAA